MNSQKEEALRTHQKSSNDQDNRHKKTKSPKAKQEIRKPENIIDSEIENYFTNKSRGIRIILLKDRDEVRRMIREKISLSKSRERTLFFTTPN